ncbi:toluene tolerance family protein [Desulfovibrio sp. X2]|uniref:MlaC/ttg2D family ABC transporter substrate-binding protein n=1 Tax=Desulfovibrio sp. X2 TaxID=941449 RepID=UPI0003588B0A|nr:ABC transporter substrate-binding protein [Desulfovibrio sp. X2]EPR44755.1 toluene tolerance family protein [Desulfovibrio sp. X2]
MAKRAIALAILILFALPLAARADAPMDTMKTFVDQALAVLRDPAYKPESKKAEQRDKLAALADTVFDWVELSRRTLALNWNRLDVPQRKEFVGLYRQLLEKTYMDRIQAYSDEKVEFTGENKLDQNQVEVLTVVKAKDKDIPITYRLINRTGTWHVYDVIIEGVSLVQNYRTQFNNILSNKSPKEMLDDLRQKVATGDTSGAKQ